MVFFKLDTGKCFYSTHVKGEAPFISGFVEISEVDSNANRGSLKEIVSILLPWLSQDDGPEQVWIATVAPACKGHELCPVL